MVTWDDFEENPGWVIFLWVFFFWIIIPFRIIRAIIRSANASSFERQQEALRKKLAESEEKRIKELDTELFAQVPKAPVERMRATIQLEKSWQLETTTAYDGHLGAGVAETGEKRLRYSVGMVLEFSELERAVIKQHNIDLIEISNERLYDDLALARIKEDQDKETKALGPPVTLEKALVIQDIKNFQEHAKQERLVTIVGDLLVVPYRRYFNSDHEAKLFSDGLKTKLLPEVRKLIDSYMNFKPVETVQF
jgi:hypothetical protein